MLKVTSHSTFVAGIVFISVLVGNAICAEGQIDIPPAILKIDVYASALKSVGENSSIPVDDWVGLRIDAESYWYELREMYRTLSPLSEWPGFEPQPWVAVEPVDITTLDSLSQTLEEIDCMSEALSTAVSRSKETSPEIKFAEAIVDAAFVKPVEADSKEPEGAFFSCSASNASGQHGRLPRVSDAVAEKYENLEIPDEFNELVMLFLSQLETPWHELPPSFFQKLKILISNSSNILSENVSAYIAVDLPGFGSPVSFSSPASLAKPPDSATKVSVSGDLSVHLTEFRDNWNKIIASIGSVVDRSPESGSDPQFGSNALADALLGLEGSASAGGLVRLYSQLVTIEDIQGMTSSDSNVWKETKSKVNLESELINPLKRAREIALFREKLGSRTQVLTESLTIIFRELLTDYSNLSESVGADGIEATHFDADRKALDQLLYQLCYLENTIKRSKDVEHLIFSSIVRTIEGNSAQRVSLIESALGQRLQSAIKKFDANRLFEGRSLQTAYIENTSRGKRIEPVPVKNMSPADANSRSQLVTKFQDTIRTALSGVTNPSSMSNPDNPVFFQDDIVRDISFGKSGLSFPNIEASKLQPNAGGRTVTDPANKSLFVLSHNVTIDDLDLQSGFGTRVIVANRVRLKAGAKISVPNGERLVIICHFMETFGESDKLPEKPKPQTIVLNDSKSKFMLYTTVSTRNPEHIYVAGPGEFEYVSGKPDSPDDLLGDIFRRDLSQGQNLPEFFTNFYEKVRGWLISEGLTNSARQREVKLAAWQDISGIPGINHVPTTLVKDQNDQLIEYFKNNVAKTWDLYDPSTGFNVPIVTYQSSSTTQFRRLPDVLRVAPLNTGNKLIAVNLRADGYYLEFKMYVVFSELSKLRARTLVRQKLFANDEDVEQANPGVFSMSPASSTICGQNVTYEFDREDNDKNLLKPETAVTASIGPMSYRKARQMTQLLADTSYSKPGYPISFKLLSDGKSYEYSLPLSFRSREDFEVVASGSTPQVKLTLSKNAAGVPPTTVEISAIWKPEPFSFTHLPRPIVLSADNNTATIDDKELMPNDDIRLIAQVTYDYYTAPEELFEHLGSAIEYNLYSGSIKELKEVLFPARNEKGEIVPGRHLDLVETYVSITYRVSEHNEDEWATFGSPRRAHAFFSNFPDGNFHFMLPPNLDVRLELECVASSGTQTIETSPAVHVTFDLEPDAPKILSRQTIFEKLKAEFARQIASPPS